MLQSSNATTLRRHDDTIQRPAAEEYGGRRCKWSCQDTFGWDGTARPHYPAAGGGTASLAGKKWILGRKGDVAVVTGGL
jgi:hypothetical protein